MTLILGIDTATSGCSAALLRDGICLAEGAERMARGQSEVLMPMIETVVRDAGIAMSEIDAIAVTRGPGAFTGLRIGLAAARSLALTLDIPCLGIGTFDVLAAQAQGQLSPGTIDALLVVIESKRAELFTALYDPDGVMIDKPVAVLPDDIPALLGACRRIAIAGDAAEKAQAVLPGNLDLQLISGADVADAKIVAGLARLHMGNPAAAPASPFYLRAPDVTIN